MNLIKVDIESLQTVLLVVMLSSLSSLTISKSCLKPEENVTIICNRVSFYHFQVVGRLLTCKSSNKSMNSTIPESMLSSVVHANESEVKNINEIETLYVNNADVEFLPTGIKNKFKKLRALYIQSSKLLSITKENLEEFGSSLEFLWLPDNNIVAIEADLFEYNANIKVFSLNRNLVYYIEPAFFINLMRLKKIQNVNLQSIGCMDQEFDSTQGHNMKTFKWDDFKCHHGLVEIETLTKSSLDNELCML